MTQKSNTSKDWLELGLYVLGALPVVGKVTAPAKLAKLAKRYAASNPHLYNTVLKYIEKGNKIVDTPQELIPGVKQLTAEVQKGTSNITNEIFRPFYDSGLSYPNKIVSAYGVNSAVNLTNAGNNTADLYQIWNSGRDAFPEVYNFTGQLK